VRCERDALVQVLFNLVDNAVKYAHSGTLPEIVLRCTGTATPSMSASGTTAPACRRGSSGGSSNHSIAPTAS